MNRSGYVTKNHYYLKTWRNESMEHAHNQSWIQPAGYVTYEVSREEYFKAPKGDRNGIKENSYHLSYSEFVEYWEKEYVVALKALSASGTIENAEYAIHAVTQYKYILEVKNEYYSFVDKKFTEIMMKVKDAEREALDEMLVVLERKLKSLKGKGMTDHKKASLEEAKRVEKEKRDKVKRLKKELADLEG